MPLAIKLSGINLPGNLPNINEFALNLPTDNLVEAWRAYSGITESSGFVTEWKGWLGDEAVPGVGPLRNASIVETGRPSIRFSGAQYLITAEEAPTEGYFVMAYVPRSVNASALIGRQVDTTHRLMLGHTSGAKATAAVGSLTTTNLAGTTTLVAGTPYVVGVQIIGTSAKVRVNNVEEKTGTFTGAAGSGALWLGGVNQAGVLSFAMNADIAAVALYSGAIGAGPLSAIDKAMGKFVGLTL